MSNLRTHHQLHPSQNFHPRGKRISIDHCTSKRTPSFFIWGKPRNTLGRRTWVSESSQVVPDIPVKILIVLVIGHQVKPLHPGTGPVGEAPSHAPHFRGPDIHSGSSPHRHQEDTSAHPNFGTRAPTVEFPRSPRRPPTLGPELRGHLLYNPRSVTSGTPSRAAISNPRSRTLGTLPLYPTPKLRGPPCHPSSPLSGILGPPPAPFRHSRSATSGTPSQPPPPPGAELGYTSPGRSPPEGPTCQLCYGPFSGLFPKVTQGHRVHEQRPCGSSEPRPELPRALSLSDRVLLCHLG
ncbi:basic proline-rich protein-like [Lemur catta]|uniref:basic proline-rich protein-like n=1 Tax=Lemur catta TaxID=9447 RepID=UPI001E26B189|nr:basic proline-rich protein-like [Lemur catta]